MRRALALLRPEPGWTASAAAARAHGLEVVGQPLFEPEALAWETPAGQFDGLLVGSAATFRLAGPQLREFANLPVHAVGEATAAAARAAGFHVERTGDGYIQRLLDDAAGEPRRFLRLCGEERVPLAPHPGQKVTEYAVYRMTPRPIGPDFAAAVERDSPLVAFHSAAAARHFGEELDRLGIARGRLFTVALSPRIARAAGPGWAALHIAEQPSEAALLAKAAALCK